MKKRMFEIYLTAPTIDSKEWLKLFYKISKINGLGKKWNLWISIENNYIRYFIETKRTLPPVIGEIGSFLIKEVNINFKEKSCIGFPCLITKNYDNLLDMYDRLESRQNAKIKHIKIIFYPYKSDNYFSKTFFYIKQSNDILIKRKALGNDSIYNFINVDFSKHIRFFYKKSEAKYLDIRKSINVLNSDAENAVISADAFPYLQENLYLDYRNYDFDRHSVVIGASGTGKSKLICSIVKNLSNNINNRLKYKVVIIDPHCSIEDDIGGIPSTKVIDFKDDDDGVNLFVNSSEDILSSVESIISICKNIIADRFNAKLERVLRYSINLLLTREEFNLVNLRKLLTETKYRNTIINDANVNIRANVIEFFQTDYNELKTKSYQEAIAPIIAFIDEMQLLPAFNNVDNTENIKQVIEENFLTIISLDQMTLGQSITKTIAGFTMQAILQLIQAHTYNEHIILVIDEVALIENPIICRFLAEARKYNLSVILSGQYFEQISSELQKAIFTNVVNYFIFRVSKADAVLLEGNMQMEVAVRNSIVTRVKMLTELNDRECIVRIGKDGRLLSGFKGRTLDFVSLPRPKKIKKNKKNIVNNEIKKKVEFTINTKYNLENIMKENSTSRKKINL